MKIVILDGYALNPGDLDWTPLKQFGEVFVYDRTHPEDVIPRSQEADMILTNKVPFDKARLQQLPHLKYIGVTATGYNIIDTDAAKQQGITVTNIPAYSTESVAQMVFAHILNQSNHVEHYAQQVKAGKWTNCQDFCYWDTPLIELADKKIGIVGLGNTGKATARIAQAFGMKVYAYTSKPQEELGAIQKVSLDELFKECDFISLHCPLTAETKELVNAERLSQMKKTAIVINTGRGPLIHESDMAAALNQGLIAGFGTDVLSTEPPKADNPLLTAHNACITPHIAWATTEARHRLMDICIHNIQSYQNGTPTNVVNP